MRKFWYCLVAVILIGTLCVGLGACNKKTTEEEEKKDVIDEPVKAEGIALNWQEVLMVKGSTVTLTHTLSPTGATGTTTFTSSDTSVVQVNDQGLVSAVKAGVATVTAKIDNSHYAECKVVVGDILVTAPSETTESTGNATQNGGNTSNTTQNGENGGNTGNTGSEGEQNGDNGAENGTTQGGNNEQGTPSEGSGTGAAGESGQVENTTGNQTTSGNNAQQGTESGSAANGENAAQSAVMRTVAGGIKGTTLFDSIQEAVSKAKAEDVIVIDSGTYKQSVSIDKNVTLMGVDNPKMKGITISGASKVKLQNLTVITDEYPAAGEAAVHVLTGGDIEIKDCAITSADTGEPEGGYGVLVEKQSKGVKIVNNSIGNFRYGIYVRPTDQSVTITNNRFSNMAVGVGLDVRQENAETNYPTLGKIADNEYNEVTKHTQFLHYGENYEGDFDFGDNEEENASQGNSASGGAGLLE